MVLYGRESVEPFDKITGLTNKIFFASHRLGQRYWKDQGRKKLYRRPISKTFRENA